MYWCECGWQESKQTHINPIHHPRYTNTRNLCRLEGVQMQWMRRCTTSNGDHNNIKLTRTLHTHEQPRSMALAHRITPKNQRGKNWKTFLFSFQIWSDLDKSHSSTMWQWCVEMYWGDKMSFRVDNMLSNQSEYWSSIKHEQRFHFHCMNIPSFVWVWKCIPLQQMQEQHTSATADVF